MRRIVSLAALVGSLLVVASASADTTFTVTTNGDGNDGSCTAGDCTLREAIGAANATAGLDTINFAPAVTGTIELNSVLPTINSATNLIGPGAENLNIHRALGAPRFRIFHVTGNPVSISGLKISNGRGTEIDFPDTEGVIEGYGGGIYNEGGNLVLDRVVVSDNHVFGTRIPGGNLTNVDALGGGIFNYYGSLTVRRSVVEKNSVTAFDTGNGLPSSVTVRGGGIYNSDGAVTVESTKISENTASGLGFETDVHGGGVFNGTRAFNGGSGSAMTITNSLLVGNAAGNDADGGSPGGGGGLANARGTVTLLSTTVSANRADDFGGGIDTFDHALTTLNAATIAGNTANIDQNNFGDGGGTWNGTDAPGGVAVGNTLYYDNHVGGAGVHGFECAGPWQHTSLGYNRRQSSDTGRCLGFTSTGDFIDAGDDVQPLADNGGLTFTHALTAGSSAVNAGNPATPGSGGSACPATDQRGFYRGGSAGRCDIGAFELGATVSPPPSPSSNASPALTQLVPGPTGQRAAALKKCKKKKSKKARKKCKKRARRLPV